ncbi:MAG: thioesterase family protein [Alphaproteobacteria bacterium]|nr:thioesterase family protein [Alphaproteobacteria bacterium]
MSTHPIDTDTALERIGPARYAARTSKAYSNFNGTFGGFTAAILLRTVLDDERRQGVPVALTVNYCAALADGPFELAAREVRTGKSTQHWFVELRQGDTVAATATVVCGQRRAVWSHHPAEPPHMPPPETLPVFDGFKPGGWTGSYEMRFAQGAPNWVEQRADDDIRSARSQLWMKDKPDRPLDYLSLASMSDAFIIRAFLARSKFVPTGTVTLTTFFHANEEAMRAQGTSPLLCTADAHLFADGFADQIAHLWGKDGKLLATSTQIVWYKE